MIDAYGNKMDWKNPEVYFYDALEQKFRAECTISRLTYPDSVYQDRNILLNSFSQNQFDWEHYVEVTRFSEATMESLKKPMREPCEEWINQQKARVSNLLLVGDNNTGKTHAAYAVARFMSLHGVIKKDDIFMPQVRILNCPDAHNILDGWKKGAEGDKVIEKILELKKIPLLVIDDIGAVSTSSQAAISNIVSIVSYRYDLVLPTIITSNQKAKQLVDMYGSTMVRRLVPDKSTVAYS